MNLADPSVLRAERNAVSRGVLAAFRRLHTGRLVLCGPRESYAVEGARAGPDAQVDLRSWHRAGDVLRLPTGRIHAYLNNAWDSPDLASLLTLIELNQDVFPDRTRWGWRDAVQTLVARCMNTNVHARYRLSNEFYRAWLDSSLTYSAGMFDAHQQRSLEQAQTAKFERILQALRPAPGALLLDIGCGWGAFARYAAVHYGCRVDAVTLSRRQVEWARERVHAEGLERSVKVELCDLRKVSGRYDFVVSVEAYEALGGAAWNDYFHAIARCLREGGKAFVQAAVLSDAAFERDGGRSKFLRQNIQADAQLASWGVLEATARRAGLTATSVVALDDDYVRTLRCWRERFGDAGPQLAKLGLDQRFQRLWHFYLSYCEAGYRAGVTRLVQAQLQHGEKLASSPLAKRSAPDKSIGV